MDGPRFDRLAREMATARSRRSVAKGMTGGLLAGAAALLGGRSAIADHKPDHCAKDGQKAHLDKNHNKTCCPGLLPDANDRCIPDPCAGVDCSDIDTACSVGVCAGGACRADAINVGLACDDGLFCTTGESCQADGTCGGGSTTDCSHLDGPCTAGACDGDSDGCVALPANVGDPCDDGLFCTTGETCQPNGTCGGGGATDCSQFDGPCTVGACSEDDDACEARPTNVGGTCDDGQFCTTGETCQPDGTCGGGDETDCAVDDPCLAGFCDEAANACGTTPANEGGACTAGTLPGTCLGGACQPTVCPGAVVTGGPLLTDPVHVDDDLQVLVNGSSRFNDANSFASVIPPIPVGPTTNGDTIRVVARNSSGFGNCPGGFERLSPLYLHCPATGTSQVLDAVGVPNQTGGACGHVFYDQSDTVAL